MLRAYHAAVRDFRPEAPTWAEVRRITDLGGSGLEPQATFLRRGLALAAREELAWLEDNVGALVAT